MRWPTPVCIFIIVTLTKYMFMLRTCVKGIIPIIITWLIQSKSIFTRFVGGIIYAVCYLSYYLVYITTSALKAKMGYFGDIDLYRFGLNLADCILNNTSSFDPKFKSKKWHCAMKNNYKTKTRRSWNKTTHA